jgi:hypothetical protein
MLLTILEQKPKIYKNLENESAYNETPKNKFWVHAKSSAGPQF